LWSPWSTRSTPIYSDPHSLKFCRKCGPGWIRVDLEDQGDHNPPWWTRTSFYILLMLCVGTSPSPSATLSYAVLPRPQLDYTTSKASLRWALTPPSGLPCHSSFRLLSTLALSPPAPPSTQTWLLLFLPPPPPWSSYPPLLAPTPWTFWPLLQVLRAPFEVFPCGG